MIFCVFGSDNAMASVGYEDEWSALPMVGAGAGAGER